jgi:hypothetical protein
VNTKADYTFVQENESIVFRSKVKSFDLDHVTDKDLASFYFNFSKYSMMDTGLLPLDGTGLLGIRKAGDHTQVIYQHKPGTYYVNWGGYEKDVNAKKYYLAQPYRIVIIDFLNDNLLGARTFYSPIPATHPDTPLYHVNLPNINCKGYRGNAVGWICLYHNEDWSSLPFNERLMKAIDRCSGTEAYNDSNMSETDGPRFYCEHYKNDSDYEYLWNPSEWEKKTSEEGFTWTLYADLWIPILVDGIDSQSKHNPKGQHLTLKMAIFGNYQAYYSDKYIPKPINAIERNEFSSGIKLITNWFTRAFVTAKTTYTGLDIFSDSLKVREQNVHNVYDIEPEYEQDEPDEDHDEDDEGPF